MKNILTKAFFPLVLVSIAIVLCLVNYTPNTILSGWDTLHPEFNLGLYLQRIIFGVWQEHQGLGAVAVQAQASELGRLWYLWIPFRYGYFWLMLVLGPLGIYKLLGGKVRGFLGGLFYLLNLGTLQHFYLPQELFATAYAFLPWLFWAILTKKTKTLFLLFLLSAPMAHTPTLWIVNFIALILFALVYDWRWGIKVAVIGLGVNSFWLLPTTYYFFAHGGEVANSHISQQFTFRAVAANKEFANIFDVALIKGYLFDWGHFDFTSRQFTDLFSVWKNHLEWASFIGYLAAVGAVLGAVKAFFIKDSVGRAMISVLLLAIAGLMVVFDTEILRFPFTKFSLLLMVVMAYFFGVAAEKIGKFWPLFFLALVIYMWPAFNGNLISSSEKVVIPQEYFAMFDWFSKQDPSTRIAPFPLDSIYGWVYYRWDYEGAGFRWFGLPQPLLDREFDRWNPANENYYWGISNALYSKNLPLFESVLNKYRVNWLLVDGNVINPNSLKALYIDELAEMVRQLPNVKLEKTFGKIQIYSVKLRVPTKSFVSVAQNLPEIGPTYKWGGLDQGYFDHGDYINGGGTNYPYRTLFTGRSQADLEFDPVKIPPLEKIAGAQVNKTLNTSGRKTDSLSWNYPSLSHREGYLITVEARNIQGKPFLFWIEDLNSRRAVLETYLSKNSYFEFQISSFVLPPMEPDGLGYSIHLDNISVGKETAINEIKGFEINKIDYWGLVTQQDSGSDAGTKSVFWNDNFQVDHPNPALYKIDVNAPGKSTLILAQSYDPDWVAFGATKHKLINNWANGWEVESGPRVVYLFFWPQLLEFFGLGILGSGVGGLFLKKKIS